MSYIVSSQAAVDYLTRYSTNKVEKTAKKCDLLKGELILNPDQHYRIATGES
jgi:hypothetical protein